MKKHYSPKYVVILAQALRLKLTPAEELLWSRIGNKQLNGLRFRSPHPIGRYIADFYCHELKLIVEVDGDIHDSRQEYDENRDAFLAAGGYAVVRVSNDEVLNSIDQVISKIRKTANELRKSDPH